MTHDEAAIEVAKIKLANDEAIAAAMLKMAEDTAAANKAADAIWAQVDKPAEAPAA